MIDFTERIVLITGAAGAIGLSTARLMGTHGAQVALCDLDSEALELAGASLASEGVLASCHVLDVADPEQCRRVADSVAAKYGTIDHLVHSAGIYPLAQLATMTDAEWQQVMSVNVNGSFHIARAVIPHLGEHSSIVNLASIAGHRGSAGHSHYAASKAAVLGLTRSLALELAPRTRVNAVSPGVIDTSMTTALREEKGQQILSATPLQRWGTPDEVAGAIAFLCSPLASYVTGETIIVSGGLYVS